MYKFKKLLTCLLGLVLVTAVALSVGCSSVTPYTADSEAEGMMSGPGLLTGENGEKTIFRVPEESGTQTEKGSVSDDS